MLRITALSLLLGAAALLAALTQFFPPLNASRQQAPAILWNTANATVTAGTPTFIDNALQLQLDSAGAGLVTLVQWDIDAQDFSFVHLGLEQPASDLVVTIAWTNALDPEDSHSYTVESQERQALWLATEELRGWSGKIGALSLRFSGGAGDTVLIRDFSVYPASATRQLQAIYSDLLGYAPWNTAAMNTYTGVFNVSSFYPVVLAVALLLLSVLAYGLLVFIFRARLQFDPAVVVLIFFTSWIMLDMFWQHRLLHQLVDTHRIFAGKSSEEKLAVGPDAALYDLVSSAKPQLQPPDSRIFVASTDIYRGMRTAYYFYPFNVYWSLNSPALPRNNALRRGDYVVLISPSALVFDHTRRLIVAPHRQSLSAELVFADHSGTVVRIN